jgi:hypothetical protein
LWTIPFLSPVNLVAGTTYLAVVGSYDGTLRVSNAGSSEQQTSFFLDLSDNTWYYTTSTPVVRMNFDPTVNLYEISSEISEVKIYPNPATTETTFEYTLANSSDVVITLSDLSGKEVSKMTLNNVPSGLNSTHLNCNSLQNGVYYVTIDSNGSKLTRKLIKN